MCTDHFYSLDRIEGEFAVLVGDVGACVDVPISQLPDSACEGKLYRKVGESFLESPLEEEMRRQHVRDLQNRLRGRK